MDPFSYLISLPYVGWLFHLVLVLVGFAIHALCALAVFNDANRIESQNRSTVLVPGYVWATAALLGGITTTVVYWLVHHSSLRPTAAQPSA